MRTAKRMLALANAFNLLVAIYFFVIAVTALVQLRWYHQLTITVKVRHVVTAASSYFAFLILILAALLLAGAFILSTFNLSTKVHISTEEDAIAPQPQPQLPQPPPPPPLPPPPPPPSTSSHQQQRHRLDSSGKLAATRRLLRSNTTNTNKTLGPRATTSVWCASILYLAASASLVIILIIWLLNTGELVRDSISTQLEDAYRRYQFSNRSNHYSVAIDGMQDINNCCGQLDYTDFPRNPRVQGLVQYPGSCCGKNIFAVNARAMCSPEEVVRARQNTGCVQVLANYYDLISLLVVPAALISLFVNITIIALITINKVRLSRQESSSQDSSQATRFELKSMG